MIRDDGRNRFWEFLARIPPGAISRSYHASTWKDFIDNKGRISAVDYPRYFGSAAISNGLARVRIDGQYSFQLDRSDKNTGIIKPLTPGIALPVRLDSFLEGWIKQALGWFFRPELSPEKREELLRGKERLIDPRIVYRVRDNRAFLIDYT